MADGVDDLGAVLDLVEPLGVEIYLQGVGGSIARRSKGREFMATSPDTYNTLVIAAKGKPVYRTTMSMDRGGHPPAMATGDTVTLNNGHELAAMLYELIDRGVFLDAENVERVRTQDLQRA